ncbi:MAG: 5-oxoprolinase subunit PxpB [Planctomycetota bacterium]|nr:MAG: 5-oxoprolinase subunit PxpB [Planctomycetota bacterium]
MDDVRVIWAGEREAHVILPAEHCVAAYRTIRNAAIEDIDEVTPGSNTVQIRVRDDADHASVTSRLKSVASHLSAPAATTRTIDIPACYAPDLAPDIEPIARAVGLSPDAAADLHASAAYTVRLLGFSPGFAYLEGLPHALHTPRLDTPRPRVRAGSIGIAGSRTGIYPQSTPGGWRLIGATPLRLFEPSRDPPALLAPGDRVRFRRIDRAEFDRLAREHA